MTPERVFELIAAYGADAARWPDDERVDALAIIAGDAALTAARDDAAELDGLLAAWALAPVRGGPSRHAETAIVAAGPLTARRGWLALGGGVALAASVAGAVLMIPTPPAGVAPTRAAALDAPDEDAQAFALLFSPTPDEESLL